MKFSELLSLEGSAVTLTITYFLCCWSVVFKIQKNLKNNPLHAFKMHKVLFSIIRCIGKYQRDFMQYRKAARRFQRKKVGLS